MSNDTNNTSLDIPAELDQLREQARRYADQARKIYGEQAEALSEQVRESPGLAILIAAVMGYIIGRTVR